MQAPLCQIASSAAVVHEIDLQSEEFSVLKHCLFEELESKWGRCLGVYAHGSAVWRNKVPADVDILAVVDEPTRRPVANACRDSQFRLGPFEVSVYTRSFWLQKLALMDLTMLTCLSLPNEFVLLEETSFGETLRAVPVNARQLLETSQCYVEFTWVKARMYQESGGVEKSKKTLSYAFRRLNFAAQMLQHNSIRDFSAANIWWNRVSAAYSEFSLGPGDWAVVEALFAHALLQEMGRVQDVAAAIGAFEAAWSPCRAHLRPSDSTSPDRWNLSSVMLAPCGHGAQSSCILERVRAIDGKPTCPKCNTDWRLPFNAKRICQKDSDLRGSWRMVRKRGCEFSSRLKKMFAVESGKGYSATAEVSECCKPHTTDQGPMSFDPRLLDEAEASHTRAQEAWLRSKDIVFGGYPATILVDEDVQPALGSHVRIDTLHIGTIVEADMSDMECIVRLADGGTTCCSRAEVRQIQGASRILELSFEQETLVARALSGDEVVCMPMLSKAGEVRVQLSEAMQVHVEAVTLFREGCYIRDGEAVSEGKAFVAKLSQSFADHLKAREHWLETRRLMKQTRLQMQLAKLRHRELYLLRRMASRYQQISLTLSEECQNQSSQKLSKPRREVEEDCFLAGFVANTKRRLRLKFITRHFAPALRRWVQAWRRIDDVSDEQFERHVSRSKLRRQYAASMAAAYDQFLQQCQHFDEEASTLETLQEEHVQRRSAKFWDENDREQSQRSEFFKNLHEDRCGFRTVAAKASRQVAVLLERCDRQLLTGVTIVKKLPVHERVDYKEDRCAQHARDVQKHRQRRAACIEAKAWHQANYVSGRMSRKQRLTKTRSGRARGGGAILFDSGYHAMMTSSGADRMLE
eukprot:TRINITY_DN30653_c0_g1_i1.p1 TRINITY_DN30653_c0_g1~~TRINITY_DN30653_c0_g1_i1.p1  ORF type:complete len:862 (+),score=145.85 TRINITY_DN30653_c0_g1_i1:70-2655(+)